MTEEKPFIGFHAAVALLHAARALDVSRLGEVTAAMRLARGKWLRPDTDRDTTLRLVEEEIGRRLSQAGSGSTAAPSGP